MAATNGNARRIGSTLLLLGAVLALAGWGVRSYWAGYLTKDWEIQAFNMWTTLGMAGGGLLAVIGIVMVINATPNRR